MVPRNSSANEELDFDWVVVGSGFGGSVVGAAAGREGLPRRRARGGRRFEDEDFAETTWNVRALPVDAAARLRGILRMTLFKDVAILSGCGVGGGSLVYANTLYRAAGAFFADPQWAELADWESELAPHYDTAERMLGVADVPLDDPGRRAPARARATSSGSARRTRRPTSASTSATPGETSRRPVLRRRGARRAPAASAAAPAWSAAATAPRTRCVKNYLWFAERRGVEVVARAHGRPTSGRSARPTAPTATRSAIERPGAWLRRDRHTLTARGVVFAAGALGTNQLLPELPHRGSLPRLSHRLGYLVRTNSEAILAVTADDDADRLHPQRSRSPASIYPDPDTHIETVTYGGGGGAMSTPVHAADRRGHAADAPAALLRGDRSATRADLR